MQITTGKIIGPQKCVIYGPEGIGKSGLAAQFPKPLFIDVEGSTAHLEVARTPRPTSWGSLLSMVNQLHSDPMGYQTLVIDTGDWAERLAIGQICAQHNISSLGGADDWGKSYNLLKGEYGLFLDALTNLGEQTGMHVVVLCHAKRRKEQVPDEFGAFDAWTLAMEKRPTELLLQWADMVLFANYKVMVIEDSKTKAKKGTGGSRVIYTTHHPCWDAKNRHELPAELPFPIGTAFQQIAHCFPVGQSTPAPAPPQAPAPTTQPKAVANGALRKLRDMMQHSGINDEQLLSVIASKGHYPANTPIENLEDKYIQGCLIPQWNRVTELAKGTAV